MPDPNSPSALPILYIMAVDSEYGPALRTRITPLMTGVGPVEAAMAVSLHLAERASRGELPRLVVSLGSAGSARLEQTAVYQADSVAYRDMDASAVGFAPGVTPFLDQPAVLPLGPYIPGVPRASLSTGGNMVSGAAYAGIAADMVDMETYAVKRVCQHFEIPLIALRGISDGDAELQHIGDWTQYLHIIDEKLAGIVDSLEDAFARGALE